MQKVRSDHKDPRPYYIRLAGLLVPISLVVYGWLISVGIIQSDRFINNIVFYMIAFWWIVLCVLQFVRPSLGPKDRYLRLIAFHLLSICYLLFVSGTDKPILFFWVLLFIASFIYFGWRGWINSLIAFAVVIFVDTYIHFGASNQVLIFNLTLFSVTTFVGLIIALILRSQESSQRALERAQRQEALQRIRTSTLINSITDAILNIDSNGKVRLYNSASLNLLDTNRDLSGDYIDKVLSLVDTKNNKVSLFEQIKNIKSTITRDDLWHQFSDGESIRLELTYAPIRGSYSKTRRSERLDGYIIIMRDITKSKSLEEERDEFISVISHELRTPITIAEGTISNAQLMFDRKDVSIDDIKQAVSGSHDQVMFLAQIVNDLSTLSRAERGVGDDVELINTRELAEKMFSQYSEEAHAKGLQFNLDLSTRLGNVKVSRLYLEEILQNIITNAIKYTKKGSVALIIKQKGNTISFAVKDTGIGISRSDQIKVFEKFWRSEDYRTRETSGTGLGLYVATKLAKKMNTKIELTSRLNYGSTFSFSLPAARK